MQVLPSVDVMGRAGSAASRRSDTFGSTGLLADDDVVAISGVTVTTPARTAADLGRLLARPDAMASLDALMRLPGMSVAAVDRLLDRFAGYRGVVQARELVPLADARSESPQESRTRLRCVDAGFPLPEPQIEVFDALGQFVARLDMGWRERLRAVEFDGDDAHGSADQRAWDLARRGPGRAMRMGHRSGHEPAGAEQVPGIRARHRRAAGDGDAADAQPSAVRRVGAAVALGGGLTWPSKIPNVA